MKQCNGQQNINAGTNKRITIAKKTLDYNISWCSLHAAHIMVPLLWKRGTNVIRANHLFSQYALSIIMIFEVGTQFSNFLLDIELTNTGILFWYLTE